MTPADALRHAAMAGRLDRFEVSVHARQRMQEATQEAEARFLLAGGTDVDGDELSVVVVLIDGCVVVTVF